MKVGDLVKHKNPNFPELEGLQLVIFVRQTAFKLLGHSGFHPHCDWEVINEGR